MVPTPPPPPPPQKKKKINPQQNERGERGEAS